MFKIHNKLLGYSHKRITKLRNKGAFTLKNSYYKLVFMQKMLPYLVDEKIKVIIIDEAGFGTQALRKYGYSLKSTPVIHIPSKISHNLTLTAAISTTRLEFVQYFYQGGSR